MVNVRKLALILGVSYVALCSALADGRVVLPPKDMVEQVGRGVTARDIALAMGIIPGFGPGPGQFAGGGSEYATTLAALTNKTMLVRADLGSAADTTATTTTALDNELGNDYGTTGHTWSTNSQNGLRGILGTGPSVAMLAASGVTIATCINTGGRNNTSFVVAKLNGTQGSGGSTLQYTNTILIGANDYWSIVFEANSMQFSLYMYNSAAGGYQNSPSSFSFTDNTAFVLALSISSGGNLRWNFNGSVVTQNVGFGSSDDSSNPFGFNRNKSSGAGYLYEALTCNSEQSTTSVDAHVLALKAKWGIT